MQHMMDSSEYVFPPFVLDVSLNLAGFLGNRGWAWAVGCCSTSLPTKQSFLLEKKSLPLILENTEEDYNQDSLTPTPIGQRVYV